LDRLNDCKGGPHPENAGIHPISRLISAGATAVQDCFGQQCGKKAVVPEAAGESAPQIAPSMKSTKIPKLAKKNKSRLPRREKKARQKGH
jgi:hypothetical protein